MSLIIAGASYKTADIATREAIAVPQQELQGALQTLLAEDGVESAAILSTCNRVEVYLDAKTDKLGSKAALGFLHERGGWMHDGEAGGCDDAAGPEDAANGQQEGSAAGSAAPVTPAEVGARSYETGDYCKHGLYLHRGIEAVNHMFRVICSLDSQVLGEAQILGQMKHAYEASVEAGACNEVMAKLFKTAIHLGKQARTETAIGSDSVSLSTTAFQTAVGNVEDFSACKVVLLGSGEMAKLVANYLRETPPAAVTVISRTLDNAAKLAEELGAGAHARTLEGRYEAIADADVVFSMVSSQSPVVEAADLEAAFESAGRDAGRKLVIVDEGVPRNVDSECGSLPGVTLVDQEALDTLMDEGLARRMASVDQVERLIDEAQREFLGWMQERLVAPTIKEIREKGDYTLSLELEHARKEMAKVARKEGRELTADEEAVLEAFGRAVVKKLLHGPTIRLRKEASSADSYYYTGAARYLFGLDAYPAGTHRHCHDKRCAKGEPCPMGFEGSAQELCLAKEEGR